MNKTEQELRQELDAKTGEIVELVARAYGYANPDGLDPADRRHLEEEVDHIIGDYEEALLDGNTAEDWQAFDRRLRGTEIGRLIQQRHEIEERILALYDDGL